MRGTEVGLPAIQRGITLCPRAPDESKGQQEMKHLKRSADAPNSGSIDARDFFYLLKVFSFSCAHQ